MGQERFSLAHLGKVHIYQRSHCQNLGWILEMITVCWGCTQGHEDQVITISWITSGPHAKREFIIVCVSVFATGSQEVQSLCVIFFF